MLIFEPMKNASLSQRAYFTFNNKDKQYNKNHTTYLKT